MSRAFLTMTVCLMLAAPAFAADEQPPATVDPATGTDVAAAAGTSPRSATTATTDIDLGTTAIKGSQELPRVLVIVPWKKARPGRLEGRPANSLLDEALAPLDRDVFARQLQFYKQITTETTEEKPTD